MTENEELKQKLEDAQACNEELTKKLKDAEDKVEETQGRDEELTKKLKDAEDEVEKYKRAHTDAQAKIEDLSKKLKDVEGKVGQLQVSAESLAQKLSIIELRVSSILSTTGSAQPPETPLIQENQDVLMKGISQDLGYSGSRPVSRDLGYSGSRPAPGYSGSRPISRDHGYSGSRPISRDLGYSGSRPVSRDLGYSGSRPVVVQENQDVLIKCISQYLGYSGSRPVAACIIYKCLLHWGSFEVERTRIFDCIIHAIGVDIEDREYIDVLAYLLSNSSTLLILLQLTPQRRRSLLRWVFQYPLRLFRKIVGRPFCKCQQLGGLNDLPQVEAKWPALLFKEQLTAFCEKTCGMIRDNMKKEISPLLELCIQAPCRTSKARVVEGCFQANAIADQQESIAHWQSIVKILNSHLNIMKANFVFPLLVRKVFTQIFYFINVRLFKSLLDHQRECSSFSNAEYVKTGLAELEQWCNDATEEFAGSAWDELECIRQAVGFLVTHEKPEKTLEEITNNLRPVSDSFCSIPFSVDDISKLVQQISIADVDLPPSILANLGVMFLFQH